MSNLTAHKVSLQHRILEGYMSNAELFVAVENLMRPQLFTNIVTKTTYELITDCHSKNTSLDGTLLYRKLVKIGLDQAECNHIAAYSTWSNIGQDEVKEIVEELFADYVANYLTKHLSSAIKAMSGDPIEAMNIAKNAITNVELALNNVSSERSIFSIFDDTVQRIVDLKDGTLKSTGYSFGLNGLDIKTGGIAQGVNVIAAVPGAGKTTLLINIIRANAYDNNIPTKIFSLEMTAVDLMTNLIANIKEINSRSLRTGNVDDANVTDIKTIRNKLKDNLSIDDSGSLTWQQVETSLRAFRKKHSVPATVTILAAIDFIQLMKNTADEKSLSSEERMSVMCNELARICKQENIALIEISQFSRETGKRDVPRPKMSDLKGSAAIEAAAMLILLLYRPEYHGITAGPKGMDLKGLVEINIAKGRYVNPEPVYAVFEGKYSRFLDYVDNSDIKQGEGEF